MIRSIYLILVYVAIFGMGMSAPFVLTLGYVWVDTFRPQSVALILLNQFPVAMFMGIAAIGVYAFVDRRSPPHFTLPIVLTLVLAFWVTATLMWAESPEMAWTKWDWAFKTIMFSAFVPWAIRSRVQIEAFVQTYVMALMGNVLPFGIKVLISGGGYGRNLGLMNGNSSLAEGGLLSTFCLMMVPLALFLGKHTLFLPRSQVTRILYFVVAGLSLVTALGTFERSALVGLVVLGAIMFTKSRHKPLFLIVATAVVAVMLVTSSSAWQERMSTISQNTEEQSANSRLLVWKWTLGYAMTHPFGGGFQSFVVSRIEYPNGLEVFGRAFHSIWFEVLGEHGWPGLVLFVTIGALTVLSLRRVSRRAAKLPGLEWCKDLADALQAGLITFFASGTFVGIAFQPAFWYFVAVSVSLSEYLRRVLATQQESTGWRARRILPQAGALPGRQHPATPLGTG